MDATTYPPVITGRGMYLPRDELTNDDVARAADPGRLAAWIASNRWCQKRLEELAGDGETAAEGAIELHRRLFVEYVEQRIGILSRRVVDRAAIVRGATRREGVEYGSDLGAQAAGVALAEAGVAAGEIDLVICGTSSPDRIYPATAIEVQERIGAHNAFAFDLLAACSSFVYGLEMARGLIAAGIHRRALVVAAEFFTCGVDYSNPDDSFYWGDGAAAVVVERAAEAAGKAGYEILDCRCRSRLSQNIRTGLGGTRPFVAVAANGHLAGGAPPGSGAYPYFFQNGSQVYREVVPLAARETAAILAANGLGLDDVRLFMFHQASSLVIGGIKKRLFGAVLPDGDRVPENLRRYGNTSSCGVAICLAEESVMADGEIACMSAFGAGYTTGTALLRRRLPADPDGG